MCCRVEVRLREHAVYPLRLDFADAFEMGFQLGWRGAEGFVVDQEGLGLDGGVGDSIPFGDLARCDLDFGGGSKHPGVNC